MTSTTTNLIDLAWIPVRRLDGTTTFVGLCEALSNATEFTEIDASSPLEHEAITRFLTTVTALVVRASGPNWDPRTDVQFPPGAVDTALDQVAAYLDLADTVNPFMQDATTDPPERFKTAQAVALSLDRPNLTVQAWHFRGQFNERPDGQVTWPRLATLLATFWYFSGTSNFDLNGSKQVGALCGNAGNGLHMFWRGPTLAHTLLANTPLAWAESADLPAWADRDGTTSGASFRGVDRGETPLWWGSYSPNTVIIWTDELTGLPALCATGGSHRQARGTPAPLTRYAKDDQALAQFTATFPDGVDADGATIDVKKECARIAKDLGVADESNKAAITSLAERLRLSDPAGTKAAEKPVYLGPMSPDLATLRNLAAWYQAGAADLLDQRSIASVLPRSRRSREWSLDFCHTKTKNPTVLVYTSAAWVGRTPDESADFTLDPAEAKTVLSVAKRVEDIADILCKQLSRKSTLGELVHAKKELKDRFYVLADAACTQAVKDASNGKEMTKDVLAAVQAAALDAFDDVLTPFAGAGLGVAIIRARSRVYLGVLNAVQPVRTVAPTGR